MTGPAAPPLGVRLVRVRVPLRRAHRSALAADAVRDSVLVCWIRDDGVAGWAECPTVGSGGYVTESTERAWAGLVSQLGPAALAGHAAVPPGLPAATAALIDARLDADLRAAGRSLVDRVGGRRAALPRCAVLAGVGERVEDLVAGAVEAVAGGASKGKGKVAPGHDVGVVRAVADAVPATPVAIDLNGTDVGRDVLGALDGLGLAYLEQPLPPGTPWEDLAACRAGLATPVALDESLMSPDAVVAALRTGAVDVVSVKPARLGGVVAATAAVAAARDAGADAFVGGMFELGIGRAHAAAVASLDGCTLPTDLGPSAAYVERDVCDPVVVDGAGRLLLPDGPGCGRTPDESVLADVAVDEVVLGRWWREGPGRTWGGAGSPEPPPAGVARPPVSGRRARPRCGGPRG